MLRLALPSIDEREQAAVAEVLRSGFLVQGPRVRAFEALVAARTGARHAVAVSNCTSALHLSLVALGIGPGDVVAVPAYSWPATINVVALVGATPAIIDIDTRTFNMDPDRLADVIRRRPVQAMLPVHAFGAMADMRAIMALADEHGVPVIEDAACALGASCNGRSAGTFGRLGCFSFHPRKAITTGEGGIVVTDDPQLDRHVRALRNHGQCETEGFVRPGYNMRMTDVQAALGIVQMERLSEILASRRARAERYDVLLQHTPVTTPAASEGCEHAYQSYVVLLPEALAGHRNHVISALKEAGIETTIGTHALPFIPWVQQRYECTEEEYPGVASVHRRALSIPLHSALTSEDQEYVATTLIDVLRAC